MRDDGEDAYRAITAIARPKTPRISPLLAAALWCGRACTPVWINDAAVPGYVYKRVAYLAARHPRQGPRDLEKS